MSDIEKKKYNFGPNYGMDFTRIIDKKDQSVSIVASAYRRYIKLTDNAIREGLIALGWRPGGRKMKHIGFGFYRLIKTKDEK